MKLGIAQLNPLIGDIAGNTKKILQTLEKAKAEKVELLVFPELAIPGYPPRDLLDFPELVDANLRALHQIATRAIGITAIVGFVEPNPNSFGRPFFNAAAVLQEGKVAAIYRKHLLPYYDVFDEPRHFEPGNGTCLFRVGDSKIAVTICEDAWNLPGFVSRPYEVQPLAAVAALKPDLVVNLSASPFSLGKPNARVALFSEVARRVAAPVVICNQVGGQDEILFDGCSLVVRPDGSVLAAGPAFREELVLAKTTIGTSVGKLPWPTQEVDWLALSLEMGVRDYVQKCGGSKVLVGLSGGIDSSVVAAIATKALGPGAVHGVGLPTRFNIGASQEDAEALARGLGISFELIPIESVFEAFEKLVATSFHHSAKPLTLENIQPRLRMAVLMALANEQDRLLLNTSNKSEIATGYSTLYGDTAGALAVVGDLVKEQVYALARYYNREGEVIPRRVLERPPSAELCRDQTDQDTLPPYATLDRIVVQGIEESQGVSQLPGGRLFYGRHSKIFRPSSCQRIQASPVPANFASLKKSVRCR